MVVEAASGVDKVGIKGLLLGSVCKGIQPIGEQRHRQLFAIPNELQIDPFGKFIVLQIKYRTAHHTFGRYLEKSGADFDVTAVPRRLLASGGDRQDHRCS